MTGCHIAPDCLFYDTLTLESNHKCYCFAEQEQELHTWCYIWISNYLEHPCVQTVFPRYTLCVHVGIAARCSDWAVVTSWAWARGHRAQQDSTVGQLCGNWGVQYGVGGVTEADVDVCVNGVDCSRKIYLYKYVYIKRCIHFLLGNCDGWWQMADGWCICIYIPMCWHTDCQSNWRMIFKLRLS